MLQKHTATGHARAGQHAAAVIAACMFSFTFALGQSGRSECVFL